jgi:ankyrin repeat protein
VNLANQSGEAPLFWSTATGTLGAARVLVAKGAYVNAQDANGNTALHGAADGGHAEVVAFLLGVKANRDMKNRAGETAADLARKREYGAVVKLLEKAR